VRGGESRAAARAECTPGAQATDTKVE